jgi:hypothetical protein
VDGHGPMLGIDPELPRTSAIEALPAVRLSPELES